MTREEVLDSIVRTLYHLEINGVHGLFTERNITKHFAMLSGAIDPPSPAVAKAPDALSKAAL